jgi:hypothetical protein
MSLKFKNHLLYALAILIIPTLVWHIVRALNIDSFVSAMLDVAIISIVQIIFTIRSTTFCLVPAVIVGAILSAVTMILGLLIAVIILYAIESHFGDDALCSFNNCDDVNAVSVLIFYAVIITATISFFEVVSEFPSS